METDVYQESVDGARDQLAAGVPFGEVLLYLRDRLPFIDCVRAVREVLEVSLDEAKELVHHSPVFAEGRHDREALWQDLA